MPNVASIMALDRAAVAAVPVIPLKAIVRLTSRAKPCAHVGIFGLPLASLNSAEIVFICQRIDVLASTKSRPSLASLSASSLPSTVDVSITFDISTKA